MRVPIAFAALLVAAPLVAEEAACSTQSLGAGVTLTESTPIAALLDAPDDHLGRMVRVEGTVTEVCEMAGCWMELAAEEAERTLRVKVKDGEIVFPVAARGRRAIAEGEFEALEMTREKFLEWRQHVAEENDQEFDPASVGEGPFRILQVRGTGAEICL